jgi:hypothetical protein
MVRRLGIVMASLCLGALAARGAFADATVMVVPQASNFGISTTTSQHNLQSDVQGLMREIARTPTGSTVTVTAIRNDTAFRWAGAWTRDGNNGNSGTMLYLFPDYSMEFGNIQSNDLHDPNGLWAIPISGSTNTVTHVAGMTIFPIGDIPLASRWSWFVSNDTCVHGTPAAFTCGNPGDPSGGISVYSNAAPSPSPVDIPAGSPTDCDLQPVKDYLMYANNLAPLQIPCDPGSCEGMPDPTSEGPMPWFDNRYLPGYACH